MVMLTRKVGAPTIVAAVIVTLGSLVTLPGFFRHFRMAGTGHSYAELVMGYESVQNIPAGVHEQARERAIQDGMKCAILMVVGQHLPITILVLIAVGLISRSTTAEFKRALRVLYIVVSLVGIFFLSLGTSYLGIGLPFPSSLGQSLVIYVGLSVILWIIIGIGVLIRGKQTAKP